MEKDWLVILEQDGNPLLSYICEGRRRGIRIIQKSHREEPEFSGEPLCFWLCYAFGDSLDDPDAVEVLTVMCCPTEEIAIKAIAQIRVWIRNDISYEEMQITLVTHGYPR